jgi:hypothetical protein
MRIRTLLAVTLSVSMASSPAWAMGPSKRGKAAKTAPEPEPEPVPEPEPAPEPEPEPPPADPEVDANREEAAAKFRQGAMEYELQNYKEAITHFEAAMRLEREPQLLFNLGQAYRRWFDVEPNIDYLRKARAYFIDYDKELKAAGSYTPQEADYVQNMIEKLDAQIELEEQKAADRNRVVITGPSAAELDALERQRIQRERRLLASKRLSGAGIGLIVAGSVAIGMGIGAIIARTAYKLILDNSKGDDPDSPNLSSLEEDRRRRDGFLLSGQVAFGSFIAGAIFLPIGIALRVTGGVIERRTLGKPTPPDPKEKAAPKQPTPKVAFEPSPSGIRMRF